MSLLLTVDIGNSRLKWALWERERCVENGVAAGGDGCSWLESVSQPPQEVVVASVAHAEGVTALAAAVRQCWGVESRQIGTSDCDLGITNGYRQPAQLGVDRWAAMVAAWARVRASLCVVDAGTALTVDAVDGSGRHLGGLILPGLAAMREALGRATVGVKVCSGASPQLFWGRDTAEGVEGGTRTAVAGLLEQSRRRLRELTGDEPVCFITGGDAEGLLPDLPGCRWEPLLVLDGIRRLALETQHR